METTKNTNIHGFINQYKNSKFKEMLGEYGYKLKTDEENTIGIENELTKGKKKRVIIYQLQR